ncbi:MAG: VPLPA-CTERM sorting domain-containing protein [Deltaproteobacteria bacterium]|nr:VPLPA-CTERM sorting domain-containing protein [Deltaproteobacteria bacterium]
MKKITIVLVLGFVLLMFTQSHAAIIWQTTYDGTGDYYKFSYNASNGGWFYNQTPPPSGTNPSETDSNYNTAGMSGDYGTPASSIGFSPYPLEGKIQMDAYAQGPDNGITPADGAEVKGYANITLSDQFNSDHGVSVVQNVSTLVNRRFMVTGPGQYAFDAHLSGPADVDDTFSSFSGGLSYGASYDLSGHATLEGFEVDNNGLIVSSIGNVETFEFNNSDRDGNSLVDLISKTVDGEDVMYGLTVFLQIETNLQNFNAQGGIMGDLTGMGPFEVGTADLPFGVSASISQVPVPGSLVLLFSGLGSFVCLRRRYFRR